MKDPLSRYTLRVEQELLDQLEYVARYNDRSKNAELKRILRKHIDTFIKEHGEIDLDALVEMRKLR